MRPGRVTSPTRPLFVSWQSSSHAPRAVTRNLSSMGRGWRARADKGKQSPTRSVSEGFSAGERQRSLPGVSTRGLNAICCSFTRSTSASESPRQTPARLPPPDPTRRNRNRRPAVVSRVDASALQNDSCS